jgi:hypothetical protein
MNAIIEEAPLRVSECFGGKAEVRRKLASVFKRLRQQADQSNDDLDRNCRFGEFAVKMPAFEKLHQGPIQRRHQRLPRKFPSSTEIEEKPECLSGTAASRLSQAFGLNLQNLFPVENLSESDVESLIGELQRSGYSVPYTLGGPRKPSQVPIESHLPLFIVVRLLHELDEEN